MLKPFQILDYLLALKRRLGHRPGPAKGILLISAGGLGDTVLFSLLADRFAALAQDGEPVTILLRSDARKMAFLLPRNMGLEIINYGDFRRKLSYRRRVAAHLYKTHYRLVISTDHVRHPFLDEALIEMAAPDQAIAMEPRAWPKYDAALTANRRLYSRLFASGPDRLDKVVRWSRFANWLTATELAPPKVHIDLPASPERGDEMADVLIQPFSAVSLKQSPVALYRQLIQSLPPGTRVALTGAPGDLDANPAYKELLELPAVSFNSSGFEDLVPALQAAKLVISVDTALMHLAVALGTPTICLASAAYVGEIVPYAAEITPPNAHIIYHSMDCEGCLGNCQLQPINAMYPCVAALKSDQLIVQAKQLLKP